ncbi:MAG: class I SAM-dependent methyltransferase [Anaerolineae bacterium]|nr:class I SAM-dependent methyltransferase [Anaerolineae bacterium]
MTKNLNSSLSNLDWHRQGVGGLWDEIGILQFQFLLKQGLKPTDYMLDVGCGSLRGGVHFIKFLNVGHYYGVDKNQALLDAGKNLELPRYRLAEKNPNLSLMNDFNFLRLNQKFNFAIAQSVFTHLYFNHIVRCLMNIEQVLLPGGKFFATFFENPQGKFNLDPIYQPGLEAHSYFDANPFHYEFSIFEYVCLNTSLTVEYIGNWNHPRNQKMMVFTKN